MKEKIITILFLAFTFVTYSQTTSIPDSNFEQALVDLGIDSDGIINGQVLTSDIDTVITLDISFKGIDDLTGIEDFAVLESLDVTSNDLTILDVSNNIQLKELYASNTGTDNLQISSLDLSNNINLELLHCENLFYLEILNLKNGNNSILTVLLLCEEEGEPCTLTELDCITVDNAEAATNNEPPYSGWLIQANFVYSEDCNLGIEEVLESQFVIYPNPVKDVLMLYNESMSEVTSIKVYDTLGRLVLEQNNPSSQLDVSSLSSGLLFVQIETDNGIMTKKIIKE
jgi:hypothetical protein